MYLIQSCCLYAEELRSHNYACKYTVVLEYTLVGLMPPYVYKVFYTRIIINDVFNVVK